MKNICVYITLFFVLNGHGLLIGAEPIDVPNQEAITENQGDTCNICLSDITTGSEANQLVCFSKHIFHNKCLKPWISERLQNHQQPNCPICNSSLVPNQLFQIAGVNSYVDEAIRAKFNRFKKILVLILENEAFSAEDKEFSQKILAKLTNPDVEKLYFLILRIFVPRVTDDLIEHYLTGPLSLQDQKIELAEVRKVEKFLTGLNFIANGFKFINTHKKYLVGLIIFFIITRIYNS